MHLKFNNNIMSAYRTKIEFDLAMITETPIQREIVKEIAEEFFATLSKSFDRKPLKISTKDGNELVNAAFVINDMKVSTDGALIPNYVADEITLHETQAVKIGYEGRTLDNFIQENWQCFSQYGAYTENGFIYIIPIEEINDILEGCGIAAVTNTDIDDATERFCRNF